MCLAWPSGLWRSPVVQCARGAPGRRSLYYLRGVRPLLADRGSDRGLPALATESAAPTGRARLSGCLVISGAIVPPGVPHDLRHAGQKPDPASPSRGTDRDLTAHAARGTARPADD